MAGCGDGVVAGGIHEHEALGVDLFGIFIDTGERGCTAFGGCSEGLFQNRGQPAELVAGGWVVVHLHLVARGVILPPMDALDEFFADGFVGRATREEMFGTVNFRRLGENGRAAMADEFINRRTKRRVGRDAGIPVRAAALQREHEFGGGHRFTLGFRGYREHGFHRIHTGGHGLFRAACFLNGHGAERVAFDDVVRLFPAADLEAFAAKAYHQDACHIRVGGVAPLRAFQDLIALALHVDGATTALHERDDAINGGIIFEEVRAVDLLRDEAGDRGRAIYRGENRDVIAGADRAIGAAKAFEGCLLADG